VVVCRPHIHAGDVVSVTPNQPPERCDPGFNGKSRFCYLHIPYSPGEGSRITGRAIGKFDGLTVKPHRLCGGEPLAFIARSAGYEITQDIARLLVRVFLGDGAKRRQVGRLLIGLDTISINSSAQYEARSGVTQSSPQ